MFVFVKTEYDWSDEFDVTGAFVMPKPHWEAELERIKQVFAENGHRQLYFGSNQAIELESFDDLMKGVTVEDCSELFFDEFKELTGGGLGWTPFDAL